MDSLDLKVNAPTKDNQLSVLLFSAVLRYFFHPTNLQVSKISETPFIFTSISLKVVIMISLFYRSMKASTRLHFMKAFVSENVK